MRVWKQHNMRVTAAVRQHSIHLQVARTNNGKFLVCPNNNQDISQQPTNDETNSVPAVVFPSYEPLPTDHHGPTILGDRYLLLGPAEGSALYRCVDVHSGQQLVAKVSIEFFLFISSLYKHLINIKKNFSNITYMLYDMYIINKA